MNAQPTKLALNANQELQITWSDGVEQSIRVDRLRKECPCATCREKRSQPPPPMNMLPVLSAAEAQPLRLLGMKPMGNYAYSLEFSDGHDTGIFTLEFIRSLD